MTRTLEIIDTISVWSGKLFSYLAWAMLLIIPYEVAARYIFNSPTIWANEAVTYLCGVYAIMGGAYTHYHNSHVSVDLFYSRWTVRTRAIIQILSFPLFFIYFAVVLWTGSIMFYDAMITGETSGTAWNPPISFFRFFIPLTAILILLQGTAKLVRNISLARRGRVDS